MSRCLALLLVLGPAATARAQAPVTMPAPDATAPTTRPARPWQPYDDGGWPNGLTLEDLRGLPACRPTEPRPGPGEEVVCRPEVLPEAVQWSFGVDWTGGRIASSAPVSGSGHALGVELGFGLSRALALGARYELLGVGQPEPADGSIALARSQRFFAQARWRAFTDEVDRDAWSVGLGLGYALTNDEVGGDEPVARLAVAREVGLYLDDENAVTAALELAYARGLGDARLDTVMASARLGFEVNIREPNNLGTVDEPRPARLWTGGDAYLSPVMLGFGVSLGARLAGPLDLVTTGSFVFGHDGEATQQSNLGSQFAVQTGPRLVSGRDGAWTPYLQVQAGPAWIGSNDGSRRELLADAEVGALLRVCDGSVGVAVRLRAGLDDGLDLRGGALLARFALGDAAGRARSSCGGGGGKGPIMMPQPPPVYVPPPPMDTPPPPPVDTPPPPPVVITPPPPPVVVAPIVIDVELGVVVGGFLEVRLDPRLLPLARLRAAVGLDVVLLGPASALPAYQRELAALLARERLPIRSWRVQATADATVRARFTLGGP